MGMDIKKLEEQIRDLPIEGQGAKRDLLPLYANSEAVDALIKYLAEPFHGKVDYVCSPEPLGFIVGSMLARELGVGLVVIRRNQQFWIDPEEQVTPSRRQQGPAGRRLDEHGGYYAGLRDGDRRSRMQSGGVCRSGDG